MITHVYLVLLIVVPAWAARTITIKNSCTSTIWPGMHSGEGTVPNQKSGWELPSRKKTVFQVADNWTAARVWARTGCTHTPDKKFQCLSANCGDGVGGDMTCLVHTSGVQVSNEPPATLAEFTFVPGEKDHYDISLVDGFNIPMNIYPSAENCTKPQCPKNVNALCPPLLRTGLDANGVNLGCIHPCNAGFGDELYGNRACCTGAYHDPELCQACGVDYFALFKESCKTSYAYAYDEKSKTALWDCPASAKSDYTIEFCPDGEGYAGSKNGHPDPKYLHATATCSSLAKTGPKTFAIKPSPTKLITAGTLQVVATIAAQVDGAAAGAEGGGLVNEATPSDSNSPGGEGGSATPTDAPGGAVMESPVANPSSDADSGSQGGNGSGSESGSGSGSEGGSENGSKSGDGKGGGNGSGKGGSIVTVTQTVSAKPTTVTQIGASVLMENKPTQAAGSAEDGARGDGSTGQGDSSGSVSSGGESNGTGGEVAHGVGGGQWLSAVPPGGGSAHKKRKRVGKAHEAF